MSHYLILAVILGTFQMRCSLHNTGVDVTVLGGGGQGFCDGIRKALVVKCGTMEGGGKNVLNSVTSCVDTPI